MNVRWSLALVAMSALATASMAGPAVTDKESPSPLPGQALRWLEAIFQAPLAECFDQSFQRSEALSMLLAAQKLEPLGPDVAWYDPGRCRHDWTWLVERFDANRDNAITPKEFGGRTQYFERLDRDRDGFITAEDLNWSKNSNWIRRDADALKLLRAMDGNGNGKLTQNEWLAHFKSLAGDKGYISPEDLRAALDFPKARPKSRDKWIECLMAGDLGSPFEGPRPGQEAPNFTLPSHDGKKSVTLAHFQGSKPVVLIFGSFT